MPAFNFKVANAQKWRAAGILLYLDPADNSTQQQFLTTSIWYPRVASSWVNGGNPFTPNLLVTGELMVSHWKAMTIVSYDSKANHFM